MKNINNTNVNVTLSLPEREDGQKKGIQKKKQKNVFKYLSLWAKVSIKKNIE